MYAECTYALCIRYCWACIDSFAASSCACVCGVCVIVCFQCGFEYYPLHCRAIWVPEGHSVLWKSRKKLRHCQALTWTALQSAPLRAAILERLAWAEIAAWRLRIHRQHQPRHPLKKKKTGVGGNLMAGAGDSSNVAVCTGLKISWVFWACGQTYLNRFVTAYTSSLFKVFLCKLSCCHVAKNEGRGSGEEEQGKEQAEEVYCSREVCN